MFYRFLLAASAAVFLPFSLGAQEAGEAADICPRIQASTVFVDDKTGSRKRGSADRISETHKTAERQGWDFKDLEIYIEDGDLQGFFITYTRPHPCNAGQAPSTP
ncbi:MAG: hypothetical protein GTN86_11680 [Xanthomonadales bacterium]|nr:hypothetical protein [Xanthomonadales bacterium]NIN60376.1 hypothetical protein [Xanthomonadales bacterium]NIN75729.1 hypothetical protein [Xanthomonadales bacterium]NIO14291.1 hypothetical protein [Xanthomonadales bacterium]NIP12769.1 hypothetical protein [Xanthomonadales bacterium]